MLSCEAVFKKKLVQLNTLAYVLKNFQLIVGSNSKRNIRKLIPGMDSPHRMNHPLKTLHFYT